MSVENEQRGAVYLAWYNDYIRLLIESGRQPSEPNAADWLSRHMSLQEYADLGGVLVCEFFPSWSARIVAQPAGPR